MASHYLDRNIFIKGAQARGPIKLQRNHFPILEVVVAEEVSKFVVVRRASPSTTVVPYLQMDN